jgi:hypothetical protein
MTTGSVFVGAAAVFTAIRSHSRQINTQIFLAYSDRMQSIRRSARSDLLSARSADVDLSAGAEIPPGALETLHLIFELFELRDQGYVRASLWTVWRRDIDRFLDTPRMRQGHDQIRREFEGHEKFIAWLEARQKSSPRTGRRV